MANPARNELKSRIVLCPFFFFSLDACRSYSMIKSPLFISDYHFKHQSIGVDGQNGNH